MQTDSLIYSSLRLLALEQQYLLIMCDTTDKSCPMSWLELVKSLYVTRSAALSLLQLVL